MGILMSQYWPVHKVLFAASQSIFCVTFPVKLTPMDFPRFIDSK